jgi:hypothetical protein
MGVRKLNKKMNEHKDKKQQQAAIGSEEPIDAKHREQQASYAPAQVNQVPAGQFQGQQTAAFGGEGGQGWEKK